MQRHRTRHCGHCPSSLTTALYRYLKDDLVVELWDDVLLALEAVLRIHDILGWIRIRIRGSMPLINGSGSSLTFTMSARNKFFNTIFSADYFLKLHLHYFSKIKSQKESQNSRNQGFSYYFCTVLEGSGSIPLTSGSGSGRPKNMWIRIRIRIRICNTAWRSSALGSAGCPCWNSFSTW